MLSGLWLWTLGFDLFYIVIADWYKVVFAQQCLLQKLLEGVGHNSLEEVG